VTAEENRARPNVNQRGIVRIAFATLGLDKQSSRDAADAAPGDARAGIRALD
jgi:hypothetical protein